MNSFLRDSAAVLISTAAGVEEYARIVNGKQIYIPSVYNVQQVRFAKQHA